MMYREAMRSEAQCSAVMFRDVDCRENCAGLSRASLLVVASCGGVLCGGVT